MEALSVVNAPEVDDQVDEADSARDNQCPAHPFGHGEPHGQRHDREEQRPEAGRLDCTSGPVVGLVCLVLHGRAPGRNPFGMDDHSGRLPATELAEFRLQLLALASLPSLSRIGHPLPFSGRWAEDVGSGQTKELQSRVGDARTLPFANGRRLYVAKPGDRSGSPKRADDLVGIHGRALLGIPTLKGIGIPTARRIRLA